MASEAMKQTKLPNEILDEQALAAIEPEQVPALIVAA